MIGAKKQILDNIVGQIRNYLWIHFAAGVFTLFLIVAGGGTFFYMLFHFLVGQEPFGPGLMERLVGIVLLAFFSMLTFSNLIITLTTTYISKETEFLVAFPIGFRSLFIVKLMESIFYSSWGFGLLSLPLFIAYGLAKNASIWFYPASLLMGIPFLVIPACLGALVTMLVSAFLPARKARIYSVVLFVAALALTAVIVKMMGLRSMLISSDLQDFSQIMAFLNVGTVPLLPNYWLARGMAAASNGEFRESIYWFLCLFSTALMIVQVCLWLVPSLYYRGWALSRESASPTMATTRRSVFTLADRGLRIFSPPVRALISKDIRTFWRDPAQWSQLIILFGLLVIYISNISGMSRQMRGLDLFIRQWPTVLSFFNMSATCFVLSILTTRFIYPMLSLEGKQYWVVGLAPFRKEKLVWEKYGICIAGAAFIGVLLTAFSNSVLNARPALAWMSMVTITVLGFGLTSLAVGLGASFPDFREDNPARIANGLGGTMNIVLSLLYIAANIGILILPALYLVDLSDGRIAARGNPTWLAMKHLWPFALAFIAINAAVIILPMRIGIRRWKKIEFHL
jgi:ABC-2 type transport system permease protein